MLHPRKLKRSPGRAL